MERLAFSPDGQTIATASRDRMARLFDADSGTLVATFAGHAEAVNDVAFRSGGGTAASASSDGTVRLWNAHAYPELELLGRHPKRVTAVGFAENGEQVVSVARKARRARGRFQVGSLLPKRFRE